MQNSARILVDPAGCLTADILDRLERRPGEEVRGSASGQAFGVRVLIADIAKNVRREYAGVDGVESALSGEPFQHFGLAVKFDAPHRLMAFDEDLVLAPEFRAAIDRFGVCSFSNVHLPVAPDKVFQKNIFPDLKFHTDRGPQFENQVSLFYRNPNDPDHSSPRRTSTLIMPNSVFFLQAEREGKRASAGARNLVLYDRESIVGAIGSTVVEMPWSAPEGTGEVCLFDNRTVVHASHHDGEMHYPIAVQYLT